MILFAEIQPRRANVFASKTKFYTSQSVVSYISAKYIHFQIESENAI